MTLEKNRKNNQTVRHGWLQKKQSACDMQSTPEHLCCHQKHAAPGCIWRPAWWWWLQMTLQKNRKNNQPVRCGRLWKKQKKQSTCEAWSTLEKTEKSINLWGTVNSRALVSSSKACTWLHSETSIMTMSLEDSREKQKKQSTCEAWLTPEKTEKTINLWGTVEFRKNNQPVIVQCTWLHSETGMMMTTLEDDSRAPLVSLTGEKKKKQSTCEVQKDHQLHRLEHAPAFRDWHDGSDDSGWL